MSAIVDFSSRSMPVPEAGCWIWLGALSTSGYGRVFHKGKVRQAHRVSWEQENDQIGDGLFVCHKCDTRSCVNPDHLFLGNNRDNVRDMFAKGRAWQSNVTHCRKGHELSGANVRVYAANERICVACRNDRNAAYAGRRREMVQLRRGGES